MAPIDPRVEVIVSDDSPEMVRERYWSHDCFLWPSKGEGCGLPPLEAMATGMDVVTADNSGMADYAFPGHCWPVGTSHMEPADLPGGFSRHYVDTYGQVGSWWVPSFAELVRQLRRCHDAMRRGRGKGGRAAEYVRAHHTLGHQARSVLEVVEKYA
jgi:glycosyltransferase involved in cell wall biosynthesis